MMLVSNRASVRRLAEPSTFQLRRDGATNSISLAVYVPVCPNIYPNANKI